MAQTFSQPPFDIPESDLFQHLIDFCENAAIGLHWVNAQGRIIWANRAEMMLLGYEPEEYIGHHIAEFHADREVIANILERLARNETLHNYEARMRCKNGAIKYVLISSNVLWQDGKFIHTRCFTRDITDRKAAEQAIQDLNRKLAERVNELEEFESTVVGRELKMMALEREVERLRGELARLSPA